MIADEQRAEPAVRLAVGVGRGGQRGAVAHPQAGIPVRQRPQAPRDGGRLAGLDEDRPEHRVGLVAGRELGGEQRVAERQRAGVDRHHGGAGARPVAEHDRHASPISACALSARRRPSAIVSPCRSASDPAVTPASNPPPCPPLRIAAGRTSSETPRLGPSVVGVRATAERTPGVARTSASAAGGTPPAPVTARSAARPALALLGDGVVGRGRAEQQRAAHADREHERRAGRREAPRGGAQVGRGQEAADVRQPAPAADRGPRRRGAPRSGRGSRPPRRGTAPSSRRSPRPCPGCRWWSRRRTAAPRRPARSARRSGARGRSAAARPRRWPARGSARPARRAGRRPGRRAARPGRRRAMAAAIGSQPGGDGEVRRGDARGATRPSVSSRPRTIPGQIPAAEPTRPTIDGLPGDHAADLAGRPGDRPQQRDLALALLDRQAHRAGDDEDRDEQRQPAERRGDGDQRGARLLELGVLGAAALVAGEHVGVLPAAARSREASKPGPASTPIASTRPGMAGQPRGLGVGQEDRRLLPDRMAGPRDADHGDGAGGLGGREAQPRAEPWRGSR